MKTQTRVPFLQILVPAFSVCFVFTITIGIFPAVTAEVESTIAGTSAWSEETTGSQDGEGQGLGSKARSLGEGSLGCRLCSQALLAHSPFPGLEASSPFHSWESKVPVRVMRDYLLRRHKRSFWGGDGIPLNEMEIFIVLI